MKKAWPQIFFSADTGDLVSRQAAILALVFSDATAGMTCGQLAKILDVVKALPAAFQWTPVEDALPIKSGSYLACNARGAVYTVFYFGNRWGTDGVIAWAELPEPYRQPDAAAH